MISGSKRVQSIHERDKLTSDARVAVATKALGYVRGSTEERATSGFGLRAQEKAVRALAVS